MNGETLRTPSDNSGFLFWSTHKKKATSPDLYGNITVGGQTYTLYGWKNIARKGSEYIKLLVHDSDAEQRRAFSETTRQKEEAQYADTQKREERQGEVDIPF